MIDTLSNEQLLRYLRFQAFLPVEGRDQWDDGTVGYSYTVGGQEYPFIRLTLDQGCQWKWELYDAGYKIIGLGADALAGKCAEDALYTWEKFGYSPG